MHCLKVRCANPAALLPCPVKPDSRIGSSGVRSVALRPTLSDGLPLSESRNSNSSTRDADRVPRSNSTEISTLGKLSISLLILTAQFRPAQHFCCNDWHMGCARNNLNPKREILKCFPIVIKASKGIRNRRLLFLALSPIFG
jgi:hypothetical protein